MKGAVQTMDYMNPEIPSGLALVEIPLVRATEENLRGFGHLVYDSPENHPIEIVRWPASGWRPVDLDSGDEGGTKQGVFVSRWDGDVLYGANEAVGGNYVLGYACDPGDARRGHQQEAKQVLLWHCNYHPDGGQLFFPLDHKPFLVPLALPGDDRKPGEFVGFWFDGSCGLYIHPNIWHDGVFTTKGEQRFFDKQGAVHARVSMDFAREFQCLLCVQFEDQPSARKVHQI